MLLLPVNILLLSHRKDIPRNKQEGHCHLWSPSKTAFTNKWADRVPCPCLGVTSWGAAVPGHGSPEAGQPPPTHSTRAELWQNHARLIIQPRTCQVSSQEYCPAHTLLLWPQGGQEHRGTAGSPVTLGSGLAPEAVPGDSPHLGEASLILFQNQNRYHHHPCPAQEWEMKVFKGKGGRAGTGQSSDMRLVTCSIPVTN